MNLASSFILTTNYDNALDVYRNKEKDGYSSPKIIEDIENLQNHLNKGKSKLFIFTVWQKGLKQWLLRK